VVALRGHEAEEALLEDGVALVPQREAEAEDLVAVADGGQAVLAPAVGAAARLVVGAVAPGVAARAVVLAHGAPRALGAVAAAADSPFGCDLISSSGTSAGRRRSSGPSTGRARRGARPARAAGCPRARPRAWRR